ncbi:regulatory protein-like protein suaprga1 [Xylona heveae TC161]|uniref:Regulatory protein-like protein suaprga1 n=1 Tax=Xylona heveae (strain CBS 132557 / TC161) TaxID=1328760 RepID=A0A165G7M4_XYLHT|nr:regulatory protein-like protein suaprga1 [Xylona heveae TC161]KZF21834.1 regulatory protein-like protein suaprga1 [Xylona heveae TC161]
MSLRSFARSVPRTCARLSAPAVRRPISALRTSSPLKAASTQIVRPTFAAAFSTSRTRWDKEGQVDQELVAKFESELDLENEMRDPEEIPFDIQNFLKESPFEVTDTPGQEEVILTRKFGDETIRVTFSIADLNAMENDADNFEPAQYDEDLDLDAQSGGAQSKGTVNQGRTQGGNVNVAPEDSVSPADRPELDEEGAGDVAFPARVNISIEKGGKGALQVETVMQDGVIAIENVYYFNEAELADPKTAEKDWARRGLYSGPPFGNLDEDLQVLLERYLGERGIDTNLAVFVPDYIDYKEQKEYINWLSNVKKFVEA